MYLAVGEATDRVKEMATIAARPWKKSANPSMPHEDFKKNYFEGQSQEQGPKLEQECDLYHAESANLFGHCKDPGKLSRWKKFFNLSGEV